MKTDSLRHLLTWARTGLACLTFLLLASPAFADEWWVLVPDGAVKYGGYNRRQGPFATAEAAKAYWSSQKFSGQPNIYSTGTGNSPPPSNNSEEVMREREAEERLRAEKELAEKERVERERKAEAERRQREIEFKNTQKETVKSLKGVGSGDPQLKTAGTIVDNGPGGFGLKGLGDTGIKDVRRDRETRDLGGAESAWKQLNAAVYLAKAAASKTDPSEMYYLATETSKVMNGEALGVALPKCEPMPRPTAAAPPGAEYKEATKLILADVTRKAAEFKQKAAVVVELAQKKTATVAATKIAQENLQKALVAPPVPVPAPDPGTTPKPESKAVQEARAALLAAQQADAEATRLLERADAEAKFKAQEINASLLSLEALDKNPALAPTVIRQHQGSPAPAVVEPNK